MFIFTLDSSSCTYLFDFSYVHRCYAFKADPSFLKFLGPVQYGMMHFCNSFSLWCNTYGQCKNDWRKNPQCLEPLNPYFCILFWGGVSEEEITYTICH